MFGPGLVVVTDNWLIQDAAELVAGKTDPLSTATMLNVGKTKLRTTKTLLGTLQFRCLTSLLEQITLAESLLVLEGYTSAWRGMLPALDSLHGSVVRPVDSRDKVTLDVRQEYQDTLCSHQPVRVAYEQALIGFRRGQPMPSAPVTAGTAIYLALADLKNCSYAPHPARARFLQQTLYSKEPWPPRAATRMLQQLTDARVKLLRFTRGDAAVSAIEYSVSPIALRCLAESSASSHPIAVAAQVRDDKAVRKLRACLQECAVALASDPARATALIAALNAAILDVEKRLRLEPLGPADGPNQINVFSLPLSVPDALRRVRTPRKHSAVMYGFIKSGTRQVREIVADALGIREKRVLDALLPETA